MAPDPRQARPQPAQLDLLAYEPGLRRYFRRRAPVAQVDDLVQEVFTRLLGLRDPAAVQDLERYIFVVAASVLARQHRRNAPWQAVDDIEGLGPPDEVTPERSLIGKQGVEAMLAVLDQLSPRTRHVFLLHRFEEMTYQRIARELGISVSAVEKHMMAALKALFLREGRDR
ncbi:RNA polymerase sigma factor [Caulobacter sp. RL271]|jgi:RNA polymerase sigma-70 factor (ECF subfamily)|uniref:Sigma-70 family RNA polymerase sigma factor n=1 Tax=Caulobacter segnis TaxID=88688 RepID=A0ABY4ZVI0_9CAUL|nr:sigma-70 family RNA polymerase sigma factor [Caulobacter segnis]USQ96581.1 sigma-70 family RNA polymerase sigma factor [Caulobacter segnis]